MRAAVGEPEHRVRVRHHLPQRVVVVVCVARQRSEEERLAHPFEQPVEDYLLRRSTLAFGHPGHARRTRRLVLRWVTEREDLLPPLHEAAGDGVAGLRLLGEESGAHIRLPESSDALGQRQVGQRAVGGVCDKRVQRRLQPEEHAGGPARDLRDDVATRCLILDGGRQGPAPRLRRVASLGERVGGCRSRALHQLHKPVAVGRTPLRV